MIYVFNWSASNLEGRGDVAPERGLTGDLMPDNVELAMNKTITEPDGTEVRRTTCVAKGRVDGCCDVFVTLLYRSVVLLRVVSVALHSHRPRSVMSVISFPGQPSSSSPHEALYPLSFDSASTNGFQMNPLSAHPPRTPRTSVTMPFSSQPSAENEETEEYPNELEVEVNDEEEDGQEKLAAKSQVRAQEIWRELLETSGGRDKTFVLHFASPTTTPTDCLWYQ